MNPTSKEVYLNPTVHSSYIYVLLCPQGSFIDVSAQRDYPKKPQQPQAKIDVIDVPIKVEETFEAAKEKLDELVQFKTALATPEKSGGGGEEDVFYIFYESDGIQLLYIVDFKPTVSSR